MEFLPDTVEGWVALVGGIVAAASAIAAVTPTPKDDKVLARLYKVVDLLAINVGRAKEKGD